jgi:hypothetical protein
MLAVLLSRPMKSEELKTKDLDTKSKTLRKGLDIKTKTLQKCLESNM